MRLDQWSRQANDKPVRLFELLIRRGPFYHATPKQSLTSTNESTTPPTPLPPPLLGPDRSPAVPSRKTSSDRSTGGGNRQSCRRPRHIAVSTLLAGAGQFAMYRLPKPGRPGPRLLGTLFARARPLPVPSWMQTPALLLKVHPRRTRKGRRMPGATAHHGFEN
jgi:hypothetical protein